MVGDQSTNATSHHRSHSAMAAGGQEDHTNSNKNPSVNHVADMTLANMHNQVETALQHKTPQQEHLHAKPADWVHMLEVATQRRTEVLMPENLENMWTKGRNYKKREKKDIKAGFQDCPAKITVTDSSLHEKNLAKETLASKHTVPEVNPTLQPVHVLGSDPLLNVGSRSESQSSQDPDKESSVEGEHQGNEVKSTSSLASNVYKIRLRRSNSTSDLRFQPNKEEAPIISEFYSPYFERHREGFQGKSASAMITRREGQIVPKLRCRVMGAYFEKLGSKSFAVYSIAVTDAENKTWFVKRRYRNFERLHRHLKDIPNYTLQLPPKRIFSSSTEDAFVHQRCIQLDKYLQDLLLIPNVAEQHEVWDFLSVSSKAYSFGKSSSMIRTLAVNVDDAVDDIVRQFKGVSDGLMRKVVGSSSSPIEGSSASTTWNWSWNTDETDKIGLRQNTGENELSSDNEESEKNGNFADEDVVAQANGWHSENEMSSEVYPPRAINPAEESGSLDRDKNHDLVVEARAGKDALSTNFTMVPVNFEDPVGVPPEWAPPNVSVPILNLVDKVFQLNKRGWLRRQVFWISKQILQLVMEDAIDDWLLGQINWLRREDTVAQGIQWLQEILWPGGTFFLRVGTSQTGIGVGINQKPTQMSSESGGSRMTKTESGSFEKQLEAARRASDIKKFLFDGAPATLGSLIGHKQYRRCARDIYYFSQSTICLKQLTYAILELLLVSIFPEMRNVVLDIHQQLHSHQPV